LATFHIAFHYWGLLIIFLINIDWFSLIDTFHITICFSLILFSLLPLIYYFSYISLLHIFIITSLPFSDYFHCFTFSHITLSEFSFMVFIFFFHCHTFFIISSLHYFSVVLFSILIFSCFSLLLSLGFFFGLSLLHFSSEYFVFIFIGLHTISFITSFHFFIRFRYWYFYAFHLLPVFITLLSFSAFLSLLGYCFLRWLLSFFDIIFSYFRCYGLLFAFHIFCYFRYFRFHIFAIH